MGDRLSDAIDYGLPRRLMTGRCARHADQPSKICGKLLPASARLVRQRAFASNFAT